MTDFVSPVGRMVQGAVNIQHQKDQQTNQLKYVDAQGNKCAANAPGAVPEMGVFFAVAYPKMLPNGQPNAEFDQFHNLLKQTAAAAWPALFPNGWHMPCINPKFSWKYQDGDGVDTNGQSVAGKAGFAGHHIIKYFTSYPIRCYHEGKFAAHEEIGADPAKGKPEDVIKRGYWVRVFGEAKTNGATGTQVPGIAVYPKLLSLVERGEEIQSGPDAATAFGAAAVQWRPAPTNSPIPTGGTSAPAAPSAPGSLPAPPAVVRPPAPPSAPAAPAAPAAPQRQPVLTLVPHLAQQGFTVDSMKAAGWTDETLVSHGHASWQ